MTVAMARMYAVMTQPWCSTPSSSPTMVGSAVPKIDWSSEDRNMLAMRAPKISQTVRRSRTTSGASEVLGGALAIGCPVVW
jgi:hypothetical protein